MYKPQTDLRETVKFLTDLADKLDKVGADPEMVELALGAVINVLKTIINNEKEGN